VTADFSAARARVGHEGPSKALPSLSDDDDALAFGVPSDVVDLAAEGALGLVLKDLVRASDVPNAHSSRGVG
jgi:hypothetical protein